MKCDRNIGSKNRIARLIAGVAAFFITFFYFDSGSIITYIGIVLGIILVLETASARCVWHAIRETNDMR